MQEIIKMQLYKDMILSMSCFRKNGKVIPAKALVILGIIQSIQDEGSNENRFLVQELKSRYHILQKKHDVKTPCQYPIYFMDNEPFYRIKWKDKKIITKAPSLEMLRNNVECISIDEALWDLLQDQETRDYFRKSIEDYYLK